MPNHHSIAHTASRTLWALLIIALAPAILTFFSFIHFDKLHTDIENQTVLLNEQVFEIENKAYKIATSGLELSHTKSKLVQKSIYIEQVQSVAEVVLAIEHLNQINVDLPATKKINVSVNALVANTRDLIPILQKQAIHDERIKEVIAFVQQNASYGISSSDNTDIPPIVFLQSAVLDQQVRILLGIPFEADHEALHRASKTFSLLNKQYATLFHQQTPPSLKKLHSYISILTSRDKDIFSDRSALITLEEKVAENYQQSLFLTEQLVSNLKDLTKSHSRLIAAERKEIHRLRNTVLWAIAIATIGSSVLFLKLEWFIQRTIVSRIVRLSEFTNASAERRKVVLPSSYHNDEITLTEKSVQHFIKQRDALERKITNTLSIRTEQLSVESKIVDAYFFGSSDGLGIVESDGSILRSNEIFKQIFPNLNKNGTEVPFIRQVFEEYLSDTPSATTFKAASGQEFRIRSIPIWISPRTRLSLYVFEDVTELVDAENEVQELSKLRMLGELSGGIAHDFNNTLSAFQGIVYLMSDEDYVRSSKGEIVRLLQAAIDQGSAITAQLLSITRIQATAINNKPANEILVECRALAEHMSMGKVTISLDERSTTPIEFEHELLINALLNLFSNAKDASRRSSEVILRCFDATIDSKKWVVFEVEDFGKGITPDHLPRVTEPLFTTKLFGEGTGIGLSSALRFTKKYGGELDITSVVGSGTIVSMRFPVTNIGLEVTQKSPPIVTPIAAGNSILVVDDKQLFGEMLSHQLRETGYKVDFATNLKTVKEMMPKSSGWNIIICDVHLTSAHGADIFRFCKDNKIGTKYVFMSGNFSSSDIERLNACGSFEIMQKPFRFEELKQVIESKDTPVKEILAEEETC